MPTHLARQRLAGGQLDRLLVRLLCLVGPVKVELCESEEDAAVVVVERSGCIQRHRQRELFVTCGSARMNSRLVVGRFKVEHGAVWIAA